ncbi:MAG: NADP-dependent malic enzyme [Pleurocapsa minor GSE-CHR-MK-17-07R]|jgi:malate dehydrogenase (oxaloacetate-decarboxylating)(NADP+)|nr:NADP-dependent malic enzyme [Pleurocapsa minor GSE-CHR-MK 17-07R]
MASFTKQDVFEYHSKPRAGKIEVVATKPLRNQRDLSLAYSPGVAEAVLEIDRNPLAAYELTTKSNLVAVISNGSAILGLGNLGPLASKPVMEGKGVLFKRFADIDVFDIEINATTAEEIITVVRALAPTFGGINLEDIKSPECFEIETRLRQELDIPVFHDDQHGTAIISGAALLNACEVVGKKLEDLKVVISGAGAGAVATAEFYVKLGVTRENITMTDLYGVVYEGRPEDMNEYKGAFAKGKQPGTLRDVIEGADMFLGLSAGGVLKPELLKLMARDPIVFALANPTPEIMPELAMEARPDALVATGRSDFPNQVNNVLGFPFIFRGALDVYARQINEEMKMAASRALAALAHEDVPDSVLSAYGLHALGYGREYLIPKPFDSRVLMWVAPAVAEAAMKSGVARREIDLNQYREELISRQGTGQIIRNRIISKAKNGPRKRVVYAEGEEPKVIRAAALVQDEGLAKPILLGRKDRIEQQIKDLGLRFTPMPDIIDPYDNAWRDRYLMPLHEMRARRGVTVSRARALLRDRNYFGPMMLKLGDADAFLSGITYEYPDVVRPALQLFHTRKSAARASGVYIVIVKGRTYLFTDATVNIDPDAETLSEIAILASDFARTLEIEPKVAMLSFSNFGSTPHPLSVKVRDAVERVRSKRPDIVIDGEMQADVAVVPELIESRYSFSRVSDANVLVFPDLASANVAYKLLGRLGGAETIGPILLGLGAPIHVLQAGDDVDAIVAMTAVAVMDAQSRDEQSAGK